MTLPRKDFFPLQVMRHHAVFDPVLEFSSYSINMSRSSLSVTVPAEVLKTLSKNHIPSKFNKKRRECLSHSNKRTLSNSNRPWFTLCTFYSFFFSDQILASGHFSNSYVRIRDRKIPRAFNIMAWVGSRRFWTKSHLKGHLDLVRSTRPTNCLNLTNLSSGKSTQRYYLAPLFYTYRLHHFCISDRPVRKFRVAESAYA